MSKLAVHVVEILPELICAAVCIVAAVLDVRTHRIPNRLTFPAMLAGLLLRALEQWVLHGWNAALWQGLFSGLLGLAGLLLIFFGMNALRTLGMGDVKLAAAVGAFVGWPRALDTVLLIFICGGILAAGIAVGKKQSGKVLRNIRRRNPAMQRVGESESVVNPSMHIMPYGPAIAGGVIIGVLLNFMQIELLRV